MQRSVEIERVINAPPERVFDAWTNPIELATWWGDEEAYHMTRCEMDLQPKGKWAAHGIFHANKSPFTISGEILTADRPFALAFTWNQSWTPGATTMVELTFMTDLNGTLLKVRHVGDQTSEAAENHRQGWELVLAWLKAHLEPVPAPTFVEPDVDALAARFGYKPE